MPFLEHDGIRFHYVQSNHGRDVVFCHGLTGSLESARELIGDMPGRGLLLWDVRGHGKTFPIGPAKQLTFDAFANDLAALLDHLEIREAVVGGISMGAAISTSFALRYPDRVRALVLVRPAWLTEPLPEALRLYPVAAEFMQHFGPSEGLARFEQTADYQTMLRNHPDVAAGLRDQFLIEDALERSPRMAAIPNDAPIRAWSEVVELKMPALVIGNEPDYVHPLSYAAEWASRLPNGRLAQVAAKSKGFDAYAGGVRREIAAFLEENS